MENIIATIKNPKRCITFQSDDKWMMKIHDGKISFNRKDYPDLCADDFAFAVLLILEQAQVMSFDKSKWKSETISIKSTRKD